MVSRWRGRVRRPWQSHDLLRRKVGAGSRAAGVVSVGAINHLPLAGDQWDGTSSSKGVLRRVRANRRAAFYRIVMPGYFETMRCPSFRGRSIEATDDLRSTGVAVINEQAARQYWPVADALGKRISFGTTRKPMCLCGSPSQALPRRAPGRLGSPVERRSIWRRSGIAIRASPGAHSRI